FKVGDLEVVPFEVDHSLPGATAFLIYASEGSILYTGDYRFHGYLGDKTREMIEAVSGMGVDVVITEGTRIEETSSTSEAEVYMNAKRLVEQTEGLVVTTFPVRDLTRFRTFHRIAGETGRRLVISFNQAYLLEQFNKFTDLYPSPDDSDLCVFAERKSWGIAGRDDYDSNIDGLCFPGNICEQDYSTWEREYLGRANTINYLDMAEQSEYIFICGYFQLNELVDVQPVPGSKYIRSITEPFDDKMELDAERVRNWLDLFGLELYGMSNEDKLHASGHANGAQVIDTLRKLDAKTVIPIHTEKPDYLKSEFGNVWIPKYGTTYSI
ncbi:MAG: MBL fold metallo-hydrolase RNA specificity domain-containing protein, partial [Candidatus Hodarchaeales archaeon]